MQEINTNAAYLVSDTKYPVNFEYAGQDTATVKITANEGEAITNDIIYGSVSGKKSDEDGKALGGAVIGIFKTGTKEFTKENAIATATSKDDGSFSFEKRYDVLGEIKPEKMPDWAKEAAARIQTEEKAKKSKSREGR